MLAAAFMPVLDTAERREDKRSEASINFEDDGGAIGKTRADKANAAHGVARLPLKAADDLRLPVRGQVMTVDYERQKIPGNDYHGNLLFPAGLVKFEAMAFAGALALNADFVPESA